MAITPITACNKQKQDKVSVPDISTRQYTQTKSLGWNADTKPERDLNNLVVKYCILNGIQIHLKPLNHTHYQDK